MSARALATAPAPPPSAKTTNPAPRAPSGAGGEEEDPVLMIEALQKRVAAQGAEIAALKEALEPLKVSERVWVDNILWCIALVIEGSIERWILLPEFPHHS
jgi:hypothetical protein